MYKKKEKKKKLEYPRKFYLNQLNLNLSLRNKNAFLHSSQLNFFSLSRRIKRADPSQRCKTAIRLSRSLFLFRRTVRWPGISSVQPPPPVRTKDIRIRGILLCSAVGRILDTNEGKIFRWKSSKMIYIYVWYIHTLRSTSLDTYAAVYTRSMATPFPFFSTRHRFIRLPVWKIARPRTSFWTTILLPISCTVRYDLENVLNQRLRVTSASNLTFVSLWSFFFLFFFF